MTESIESPAAAWYRREVERVQLELQRVLNDRWSQVGNQVIAHACIELCGTVLRAIAEVEPAAAADIDDKIGEMRLFVLTSRTRTMQ